MKLSIGLYLLFQVWTWGLSCTSADTEDKALDIKFSITDWDRHKVDGKGGLYNLQGNYAINGGLALTPSAGQSNVARITTWEKFTMFNARGMTSFATTFTFYIKPWDSKTPTHGHGFTLVLVDKSCVDPGSDGGYLGLYNPAKRAGRFVAVEFDTFKDKWDPSDSHVGLNVGDIHSVVAENFKLLRGPNEMLTAWIDYDARNLSLSVSMATYPTPKDKATVLFRHHLNLKCHLQQGSFVGFTASVGGQGKQLQVGESHVITSWSFHSWFEPKVNLSPTCN